jgi:hypothetical protein
MAASVIPSARGAEVRGVSPRTVRTSEASPNLALVLAAQKKWAEALTIRKQLLKVNPNDNQGVRWRRASCNWGQASRPPSRRTSAVRSSTVISSPRPASSSEIASSIAARRHDGCLVPHALVTAHRALLGPRFKSRPKNTKPCNRRAFQGCTAAQLDFPNQQIQGLRTRGSRSRRRSPSAGRRQASRSASAASSHECHPPGVASLQLRAVARG